MNFIIWLVVGGLIGWVASMIMKTDAQQGVILNVVVGIVGSMLGGWLVRLSPGLPFLVLGLINIGACALTIFYYRRNIVEDTARATQPI